MTASLTEQVASLHRRLIQAERDLKTVRQQNHNLSLLVADLRTGGAASTVLGHLEEATGVKIAPARTGRQSGIGVTNIADYAARKRDTA